MHTLDLIDLEAYVMRISAYGLKGQTELINKYMPSLLQLNSNKDLLFSNLDNWGYTDIGFAHRQLLGTYYLPTPPTQTSDLQAYLGMHACLWELPYAYAYLQNKASLDNRGGFGVLFWDFLGFSIFCREFTLSVWSNSYISYLDKILARNGFFNLADDVASRLSYQTKNNPYQNVTLP